MTGLVPVIQVLQPPLGVNLNRIFTGYPIRCEPCMFGVKMKTWMAATRAAMTVK
jgi:hypothetical protein